MEFLLPLMICASVPGNIKLFYYTRMAPLSMFGVPNGVAVEITEEDRRQGQTFQNIPVQKLMNLPDIAILGMLRCARPCSDDSER